MGSVSGKSQLRNGKLELGVGLRESDAGPETGSDAEEEISVSAGGVELKGQPDIGFGVRAELFAQDADHGVGIAAQGDGTADDGFVAAEFSLPEPVAENHQPAAVGQVFLGGEGAAQQDGRAEEAGIAFRDVNAVEAVRDDLRRD